MTARPSKGEDFLDQDEIRFGLTPVFLNSDLELLDRFQVYLRKVTGLPILLVTRRTYQEITALLISRQLDAAWICGYPFVEAQAQLQLVAVPIWRGRPLYRSYIIVGADHAPAADIADLRGDIHAFSDPDSNSGWLVTNALLAERELRAETFFSRTFFTYGHRDVIRAVASGLADSGSVDGYVYEVISELEPDLTGRTRVLRRSEWLGFPPVAAPLLPVSPRRLEVLKAALLGMPSDSDGAIILKTLRLDGFGREDASLFEPIARKASLVAKLDQHA
nr:PhnD/SsuA/transferrin family substrate-binding protein [Consotaella salsifontis]